MTESSRDSQVLAEYRDTQRLLAEARWTKALQVVETTSPIAFYARVKVDDYLTVTLGEWGGYYIQVMPMIFNDRLVMTPFTCTMVYDFAWCFPKGVAAALAALAWDPEAEAEPVGFIKRIGRQRLAGERAIPDLTADAPTD